MFEAFFDALAATSQTAQLVQMLGSTLVRAHVPAAGAKGGSLEVERDLLGRVVPVRRWGRIAAGRIRLDEYAG